MWKQALILGIGLSVLAGPALADRRDHRHDRHDRYDRHDHRDRDDRHRHGRYDHRHRNDHHRWSKGYRQRGYSWWTPRWGHHQYRHHAPHPGHQRCR